MIFGLQDPGSMEGYLLEILLEQAATAQRGGGSYAWATSNGADLLIGDDVFQAFTERGTFDLIVGVDWVTDEAAVASLVGYCAAQPGLTAQAFVHDLRPILFHPKYSWFREGDDLTVICGSGNLTRGGLLGNWEAFTIASVSGEEADRIETQIEAWRGQWHEYLLPLSDERVLDRARKNKGREEFPTPEPTPGGDEPPAPFDLAADVLVTEIPKGERWSQANFRRKDYEEFFGAKVGSQRRIVLFHVDSDGTLGDQESRPSIDVDSGNYRFELGAATHQPYPEYEIVGRPIGVFVRLADRTFLYSLLMPGADFYDHVSALLRERSAEPVGRMRRTRMTADELLASWPDSPLARVSLND